MGTELTKRQTEIAQLVARGMSSREIATATGLSYAAVKWHIQKAAQRLDGDGPPRVKLVLFVVLNAPDPPS